MNARPDSVLLSMTERDAILDALSTWIEQRPGLEPAEYGDGMDGWRAYCAESRSITRDLHDARTLLRAVRWKESIDADTLKRAFRAFSGRLSCNVTPHQYSAADCPGRPCADGCDHVGAPYTVALDYCAGQYFPTEYRKAACAVLASALWDNIRDSIPVEGRDGKSPGDLIRAHFRREFGARLARRYFD